MEIYLPSIKLTVERLSGIKLNLDVSKDFQSCLVETQLTFNCIYKTVRRIAISNKKADFWGHSFDKSVIPYEWRIFGSNNDLCIHILFFENEEILELLATINYSRKLITVEIVPTNNGCQPNIDPLLHPLGSLLMIYLANYSGGFLIHASGVSDNGNGYLFTGVSGIGKSTMAKLWDEDGVVIINDDRLWIQAVNGIWTMFSTPMMHYSQKPLMAPLSKIFLLSQMPENSVSQISGAKGAVLLMTNCIQHLFDKKITASYVDTIFDITAKVPVYNLGFKPDRQIVEMIRWCD
ncbi:MAG: hypothetical protein LBV41_05195 [Cytophagaceae bacterium]|jgi:hypothetical protein|nr:hypothetical protein [Cytophagaceae bacterium]